MELLYCYSQFVEKLLSILVYIIVVIVRNKLLISLELVKVYCFSIMLKLLKIETAVLEKKIKMIYLFLSLLSLQKVVCMFN